uniref:NADH-ubiquinone oxidoreductase chain 4L n=1 Tax=Staphylinidae sp. BMNH 1274637 TaxID=1796580 RepID=A0A126TFP3_9COLE|nr:NADH dehydrogenase subunit 4L [Staphylinidae sp. BMNH 1274637]
MVMFSLMMYLSGILAFSMKRKHLLMMLLSLEYTILSLYFMLIIYLGNFMHEYYFCMIFLTLSVCEGVLGLSIMVSLIRSHGNDYFQSFNILW